jgi:hypothetical protein
LYGKISDISSFNYLFLDRFRILSIEFTSGRG